MAGDLDKKKADEALLRELKEVREFIRAKMEENAKRELQESQIGALERRARREKKPLTPMRNGMNWLKPLMH
ncbi:hypothetical protein Loa_01551 [Legionella oakridgensis ATCC 33761 = DSM 21215]|uniref:Uncharacterized protein n=1 Tax=Legionella oakridgensis ATCC 33761 = DSM 21215 TaxID=1268635 RepID=W0BB58_9GAMM|nr:hypothetical protein [Legionella oakridgensis]AHE67100.1 hypothetical protein Loa_01551 [Legionella oakridgensis ATCC 33761 = DSM 21215]